MFRSCRRCWNREKAAGDGTHDTRCRRIGVDWILPTWRVINSITGYTFWEPVTGKKPVNRLTGYRFYQPSSNFAPSRLLWLKISGSRGRPPPIIFAPIVRPMNALQLCPWQFSYSCYGWGATSENRSKISNFAPTQSLWSKISGARGHPPPIIFAQLVRPMNALQLCRWQFSHKATL